MNKLFCRSFQAVMKLGNYFMGYRMPEYLSGPGSIQKLPEFMLKKGAKRALVVTDKGLMNLGLPNGLLKALEENNIEYKDFGCLDKSSCDYPEFGRAAAMAVANGECEKGIVICTTGLGISISANKVAGVRCALCADTLSAKMTRLHNNSNMLAMGAGIVGTNLAIEIVDTFLNT